MINHVNCGNLCVFFLQKECLSILQPVLIDLNNVVAKLKFNVTARGIDQWDGQLF